MKVSRSGVPQSRWRRNWLPAAATWGASLRRCKLVPKSRCSCEGCGWNAGASSSEIRCSCTRQDRRQSPIFLIEYGKCVQSGLTARRRRACQSQSSHCRLQSLVLSIEPICGVLKLSLVGVPTPSSLHSLHFSLPASGPCCGGGGTLGCPAPCKALRIKHMYDECEGWQSRVLTLYRRRRLQLHVAEHA